MYRDSFYLFCFLKEKDKDTGFTTAIYHETREIKIAMYCTPESIGNPDCQIYFEVSNKVPRLREEVQTDIKIDIEQNLTNIQEDEKTYFYQIFVTDEDGPSPILWSCSRLSEDHAYFLKYEFKNHTLSLIFNKKALFDVKFSGSFEVGCKFNDKYSLKYGKKYEKIQLKIDIA